MPQHNLDKYHLNLSSRIRKRLEEGQRKFNILVLGKTGSGKSTLINKLLNSDIAKTGNGKPVTEELEKISIENFPIEFYDTPGLELDKNSIDATKHMFCDIIKHGLDSQKIEEAIHLVLYCINIRSHRIEQSEFDLIKYFRRKNEYCRVPVIIVLTQSIAEKDVLELKSVIKKERLGVIDILPVLVDDFYFDNNHEKPAYGIDKLYNKIINTIPKAIQNVKDHKRTIILNQLQNNQSSSIFFTINTEIMQ